MLEWDIGMITGSSYENGDYPSAQIDGYGDGQKGLSTYEQHSPHGLLSIPLDPDVDSQGNVANGVTAFYALEGARGHVIPMGDPRVFPKIPIAQKGETLVYNSFGQFIRLQKEDAAITMMTTDDGTTDGQSVYFRIASDSFQWIAPWGSIKFDATGFHLLHESGARLDLGGIVGIPGAEEFDSYVSMQAKSIDMLAPAIAHGAGEAQQQLAFALPVQAILTQLIEALQVPAAVGTPPLNPASAIALATQIDAIMSDTASS